MQYQYVKPIQEGKIMMIHVKINKLPGNILMDCINVDTYVESDGGKCYCFADLTDEGKNDTGKLHILRYHIRDDELVFVREIEVCPQPSHIRVLDSAVTEILKGTLGDKFKTGLQQRMDAMQDLERWQKESWEDYRQYHSITRFHAPDMGPYPFMAGIDPKGPEEGGSTATYFCDGNLPLNPKGPHNGHDGK